jgi:SAM-dependent methyltransferase
MEPKAALRSLVLDLRHELDGYYDAGGERHPGDLERRLASIGVRRDRDRALDELRLPPEDVRARAVIAEFLAQRAKTGQNREEALDEFVRESAYTWANRLLALRCMEARELIDEVILQKDAYGGHSLQHNRFVRRSPELCIGEDEGLFAVLFEEFARQAHELPLLFDPNAPEVALRPTVAALKRCVQMLSIEDSVFTAPDALGWAYQYWNSEEKDRIFENVRTRKGAKIEGGDIIPATCIYTENYIVRFLVQNSLGALWVAMHPDTRLARDWEYYVHGADRAEAPKKPLREVAFLDPACGSGHFLLEAFELLYAMYREEGEITDPAEICKAILERNLYGIDIDARSIQIAALALVLKAKEKAPNFVPRRVNLVATDVRLSGHKDQLEAFLRVHSEDQPLYPALVEIFEGLGHADELGSLLRIEQPLEKELRYLRDKEPLLVPATDWEAWEHGVLSRLRDHFDLEANAPDLSAAFFGRAAGKGLSLVDLLVRHYDVVAANPPYMGSKNMGAVVKSYVERHFAPGKRDLYAAFILRCEQLAGDSGRVAMVTQQSWMFLRSFAALRAVEKPEVKGFNGVLRDTEIETLAHLGPNAFAEVTGEVVNTVMFVLAKTRPVGGRRLTAFRLVGPKTPEEKDAILKDAVASLA